jgi:hypothetical protein
MSVVSSRIIADGELDYSPHLFEVKFAFSLREFAERGNEYRADFGRRIFRAVPREICGVRPRDIISTTLPGAK